MASPGTRTFRRWDVHQRLQHAILAGAFALLVVSGMPLKYPDALLSRAAFGIMGGAGTAGMVHRVAAVVLIAAAVYHIVYLVARLGRRRLGVSMLPGRGDFGDFVGTIAYFFGLRRDKPKFGRYSFKEKLDYWGVAFGAVVMIVTGLILWFPDRASDLFRGHWAVAFQVARVVHSYEALLAFLAVIVWHLYHVILAPNVFPMSWVWLTGEIPEDRLKAEHPLEYETLTGASEGEE